MRIFFGKIKPVADNKQIDEAYYETLSPTKLAEIKPSDYAFIVSGRDIHLWKAKELLDIDGHPRMEFEIIHKNLPLSTQKFIALKFFRLDISLMVLTVRQSLKAFYPIQLSDPTFSESMLVDKRTYENEQNFRKTIVLPNEKEIAENSTDIQLYFKDGKLKIVEAPFFDHTLFSYFIDNIDKLGKGRREKDKALSKIKEGQKSKTVYSFSELPILRTYDALFNPYGDQEVSIKDVKPEDENEANHSDPNELKSYNQIYYGPPGTGKTYFVQRNFCVEEESHETSKEHPIKLDIDANFWHLAPGRNGHLWNQLKQDNYLGYEWAHKDWGDLNKLTPKHIEEEGEGNYQLISYLREVETGDYICVISGRKLLGIAEVTENYNFERSEQTKYKFQTVPVNWIKKFDPPLYLNSSQTKTFVRLNDGRRWNNLLTLLRQNGFYFNESDIEENKFPKPKNYTFVTFHQSFSYEDFIEGIKPVLPESEEDQSTNKLQYEMAQGVFYQACDKAAQLAGYKSLQDCIGDNKTNRQKKFRTSGVLEHYLIIDELNRGNVAAIFGELISLIEDDKRLGAKNEITLNLPYSKSLFGVPLNLRIVGTMNTADRSIEALDTALRRRFSFEEILPNPFELDENIEMLDINPRKLLITMNQRIRKLLDNDHTIGHAYLIDVKNVDQLKTAFANKIIPLLKEYFYGDYGRVGLILGKLFIDVIAEKSTFMPIDKYEIGDLEDKTIFSVKDVYKMEDNEFITAVKAIYGG